MAPMRYTITELIGELALDREKKILFVEGGRDLSFWRKFTPPSTRPNSSIYPICMIDVPAISGGERGRLIELVKILNQNGLEDRVSIFIDGDNNKILELTLPDNAITTDYRDLETYCFNAECINELIQTGLANNNVSFNDLSNKLISFSYPIGLLRIESEESGIDLPFQRTFQKNKRKNYILNNGENIELNEHKLLVNLIQNSSTLAMTNYEEIKEKLDKKKEDLEQIDIRLIIHGKDWFFILAELLSIPHESVEALLFISLNYEELHDLPNLKSTECFLCTPPPELAH
ncbi:DUF4435 domain-containing protein [Desulfogranum marinum]|uniref:DUF4435 domain-containing protein n=1 Tax=Desulfogranum marinum TaxID=453220 RepID=UPI0029C8E799|nr:DUF4435 domain-containing protein [Desulfogranum marinum]